MSPRRDHAWCSSGHARSACWNAARAQLQGFLDAVGATTPTGAGENAKTYLPDGMNAASLKSHIDTAITLMQQKVDAFNKTGGAAQYGSGGTQTQTNTGTTNSGGWASLGD